SPVSPNEPVELASTGIPNLGRAEAAFGVWDELLALRSMSKLLAPIPGRKIVVMLTSGFVVPAENMSELTAAISECNRANVAIYPIDVRGLSTGMTPAPIGAPGGVPVGPPHAYNSSQPVGIWPASFTSSSGMLSSFFQHGGGGGGAPGGGGGAPGGGGG